ncbi:MAG: protein YgfX [Pseudomonadota bacterium]
MRNQAESIHLRPVPSRYLAVWLVITHAVALIVIWQIQLHVAWKISMSLALLGYLIWQLQLHLLRRNDTAILEAIVASDGIWHLTLKSGIELSGELLPDSFVKPWLMVLGFRIAPLPINKRLILFPDSLDKETARRLRVHLLSNRQLRQGLLPHR